MVTSRPTRGLIFDQVPWLYDRYRAGYPADAVDALVELAAIVAGSRVLEVGGGTGQLTIPLLQRGASVTALEPGSRMAALLRRKLGSYPESRVIESRLEDAAVSLGSFDALVSATAFHWVDPAARYRLAARALGRDGAIALMRNDHVLTTSNAAYYRAAAPIYERLAPELGPPFQPSSASEAPVFSDEMAASGEFRVVDERRFTWEQPYTSSEFIALLRTYSNHRAMQAARRRALLSELRSLVDTELGGRFVDGYVTTLCVGRRIR